MRIKTRTYNADKLSEDILDFIVRNGIDQAEFAKLIGISTSGVSRIINKVSRYPHASTLTKICEVIDKDVTEYVGVSSVNSFNNADIELMSIDELTVMIGRLEQIRSRKVADEIKSQREALHNFEETYGHFVKEVGDS